MQLQADNRRVEARIVQALELLAKIAPESLAGPALDVACGAGRHALLLARRGIATDALDRDPEAIATLAQIAAREGIPLAARVLDLEPAEPQPPPSLGAERYSLVVVVNYLHRRLCGRLSDAIRPGGALIYETFTKGTTLAPRSQPSTGGPRNPSFLLAPGELPTLFPDLRAVSYREGLVEESDGHGRATKATFVGLKLAAR